MLKIGEFSKLARVSVKTLRYYADLGLLRPAYVDRYSGYRYYDLEQLPRLNRILALKELGFSLVQIERMVREDLGAGELQRLMRLRHAELLQQVQAEQARLERVAVRLRQIEQEGRLPAFEVRVRQVEPCQVAGIRDTVAGYGEMAELFRELWRGLGPSAAVVDGPAMTLYYDAEYREQGADVEVAVPVAQTINERKRPGGRLHIHSLPKVEAASAVYTGSYEGIASAYSALMSWTQGHGYRAAGPNRELYLQGPGPGVEPGRYVTEVLFPVERLRAGAPKVQGGKMEPRIVTKEAFTVVGIPFKGQISSGPYEDGQNNNEIGKAWDEFNARAGEVRHISGPAIGLCFGMPNDEQPWYIAGMEVSEAGDVPPGMMAMAVSSQKYAVFKCTLPTLGQTYGYIMEQWQPNSGYQRGDGPDFELYDEEFVVDHQIDSPMYVYWPIK